MPSKHLLRLRGFHFATLLAMGLLAGPAAGTVPATAPAALPATTLEAEPSEEPATLRFYNRDIITFRSRFLGHSPATRVEAARNNITRVVFQPGVAKLGFNEIPSGLVITINGEAATIITPADLDTLNHQTMAQARAQVEKNLGAAIRIYETQSGPRDLAIGVGWSLLAVLVTAGLLYLLVRMGGRWRDRFDRWVNRRVSGLHSESARHFIEALKMAGSGVIKIIGWLIALLILEEMVRFILGRFPYTRPWAEAMTGWLWSLLSDWGMGIVEAIPGLLAAALILFGGKLLAQAISLTFRGVQSGRFALFGVDAPLAEPTRKLVVAVVWLFAIAMAYPYLPGAQTEAFKGLSVLVGLMISIGASSIVGQAASGFTILYSRTMQVGDLVRIQDTEGFVQQIGLFSTRIRTVTGVDVNFPSSVVLGDKLQNFSRNPDGPGMWLETGVTIGYDTPWRQVHRLLTSAAETTPGVEKQPAPFVIQRALGDFYVEYVLRARVLDLETRGQVLSALHANIQDAFNAEGVQIMSPNYEADPETPKLVPREHWEGLPAPDGTQGAR